MLLLGFGLLASFHATRSFQVEGRIRVRLDRRRLSAFAYGDLSTLLVLDVVEVVGAVITLRACDVSTRALHLRVTGRLTSDLSLD